jgi:hypothetical protein
MGVTATRHLLSWHGTVVRVDRVGGGLIHALPMPARASADDWALEVPEGGVLEAQPHATDHELTLHPAGHKNLLALQRGTSYLCADPHVGAVHYNRPHHSIWETFLLLDGAELARLRRVVGTVWSHDGAAPESASVGEGFRLRIGALDFDLRDGVPGPAEGADSFAAGAGVVLRAAGRMADLDEVPLRRRAPEEVAALVADAAAFARTPDSRFNIRGDAEFGFVPLACCRADEDWMLARWTEPGPRRLGRQVLGPQALRARDKYVLLTRWQEGIIYDEAGACNEVGYLNAIGMSGSGMVRREGDHFFASWDNMMTAPRLTGPHVVFYGGNLVNYYHWVIDALLPLHALAPYLPAGATLLLPGTLRGFRQGPEANSVVDHIAALREWGFGDMPAVEIDAPVCHVEEVYWLDRCSIGDMPASLVRTARERALARMPASDNAGGKRVYVTRKHMRFVANAEQIEQIAKVAGFATYDLEGMTPRAQMALFRDAEFVIGPHGAGLANLLFCAPGTKVIELSPDSEFRPYFAQISDKLDLSHAVLPCAVHGQGFNGRMTVDVDKFRMLLRQMLFRL